MFSIEICFIDINVNVNPIKSPTNFRITTNIIKQIMGEVAHLEKDTVIGSKTCKCLISNTVITIRVIIANISLRRERVSIILENLLPNVSVFSIANFTITSFIALIFAIILEPTFNLYFVTAILFKSILFDLFIN